MNLKSASRWACAAAAAASVAACNKNNGEGEANGYITVTTDSGFWCRTYEGEIALGNIRSQRTSGGSTLDFHVDDPAMYTKLQDYQNKQIPVHVKYHIMALSSPCTRANDEVIDEVTPMKDAIVSPFGARLDDADETISAPTGKGARNRVLLSCDTAGCRVVAAPK